MGDGRYGFHSFTEPGPTERVRAEFRRQADMFVQLARSAGGRNLDYDRDGVVWIDDRIETLFEQLNEPSQKLMRHCVGSFLGECILRRWGGSWDWNEELGGWCAKTSPTSASFPHAKAAKRFENGPGDSIVSLFDFVGASAKGGEGGSAPPERKPLLPRRRRRL